MFSRIASRENPWGHKLSILNFRKRENIGSRLDRKLTVQLDKKKKVYLRNVLNRVVTTVKALTSRGLSFRRYDEKFESLQNGNYLISLELIAEFDPFWTDHISR